MITANIWKGWLKRPGFNPYLDSNPKRFRSDGCGGRQKVKPHPGGSPGRGGLVGLLSFGMILVRRYHRDMLSD